MLFLTKGTHQQTCFCFGSITVYSMIFHFSALQVFVHYLCPQVFSFAYFLGYFCTHTYVYLLVNLYLYLGEESPGSSCQSMGRLVFVLAPSKWVGVGG